MDLTSPLDQLTNDRFADLHVTWSPDGRMLLVTSSLPRNAIEGRPDWSMERPERTWDDAGDGAAPRPDGTRAEIRAWLAANPLHPMACRLRRDRRVAGNTGRDL